MATHLLSINDLSNDDIAHLVQTADAYHQRKVNGQPLAGKSVAMLFEKPSLRTRGSFDVATYELGGHPVYIGKDEVGLDTREPAEDVARVLSQWVAIIVARVIRHSTLDRLAANSSVPVVNALSDVEHPCQALADLLTIRQRLGRLEGVTVAFVGDANNCALSLALACAAVGAQFRIATPQGYGFGPEATAAINRRYQRGSTGLQTSDTPAQAAAGADVVYTDVWASMGQEDEAATRRQAFEGFQVNENLLAQASPQAILMHPMPAHYGEEVPSGMLLHPRSAAFDQAGNRLYAQKAALRLLVAGE